MLPKKKVWLQYVKSKTETINKDLVEDIAKYYEVGAADARSYIAVMTKEEIPIILSEMGKDEKIPVNKEIEKEEGEDFIDTMRLRQSFVGKIVNNRVSYLSSKKDDSFIFTNTSSLGKYTVSIDTLKQKYETKNTD